MSELTPEQEARARRLHKESIVVDGKGPSLALSGQYTPPMNKKLSELIKQGASIERIHWEIERVHAKEMISGRSNIEREWMEIGGIDVRGETVSWPKYEFALENAIAGLAVWQMKYDAVPYLVKATNYCAIESAKAHGKRAVVMGFENTDHFGKNLDMLQWFHELGIRRIQLTYNLRNLVGSGFAERTDEGLSNFGVEVLKRLNQLGILVDLSHCGFRTTMDTIELSSQPVAITHSFASKLFNHPFGKSDEVLKALAARNGYFGVKMLPVIITDASKRVHTLNDGLLAHVDHVASIMGPDKVGIGTDYNGEWPNEIIPYLLGRSERKGEWANITPAVATISDYRDQRDFPNITRGLVVRGYGDQEIKGIIGGNFLRIFKEVCG